jgi:hypothetical protein
VQAGLVQAGLVQAGLVQAGLVQAGLVQAGLVQAGLVCAQGAQGWCLIPEALVGWQAPLHVLLRLVLLKCS